MKLNWTDNALAQLVGIHDYIALDSPRYALAMIDRITRRANDAVAFPNAGARVPKYHADDIREVLEYPYRIIYRVLLDRVDILAVVHGARLLPGDPP